MKRDKITQNALHEVRNMKNPFQYGGVVSGDAFCNRKQEVEDLLRAMKKSWGVVENLHFPPKSTMVRCSKSSIVKIDNDAAWSALETGPNHC